MTHHISASKVERDLVRLLKDWTLPVAITVGAVLYIVFATIPQLDAAAAWFGDFFDTFLPACMFGILFVTFCKVDFRALRVLRWHIWITVFQLLFSALCVVIILWWHLEEDALILMEAALACIVCPCASAAAVVTQKLGGNLEAMTSYTFLSNIVTSLLIPLCFPLVAPTANMGFWAAFLLILNKVGLVLVGPMVLAFIVKHTMHRLHRFIIGVKDLSYYLWAMSLMVVTGTTAKNIAHADTTLWLLLVIAILSLLFCIAQFAVGRLIGRRFGNEVDAGQALGQKNTAFAIWTTYTFLHPLSSIGPGCYILWQNIINSIEIWQCRRAGKLHSA